MAIDFDTFGLLDMNYDMEVEVPRAVASREYIGECWCRGEVGTDRYQTNQHGGSARCHVFLARASDQGNRPARRTA